MKNDKFVFTGKDIERYKDQIKALRKYYANSLKEIMEIRKADRHDKLTKLKRKEDTKFTGELSWLAQGTRLDLSFLVLLMSR